MQTPLGVPSYDTSEQNQKKKQIVDSAHKNQSKWIISPRRGPDRCYGIALKGMTDTEDRMCPEPIDLR